MYILGISAHYHDSAAVLLKDGKVIVALEEERFTRVKHDNSFPITAINRCLQEAKITIQDISLVAYYEKPLLKFERILQTCVETYPFSLIVFLKVIPQWLGSKLKIRSIIQKKLNYSGKIVFCPHHLSHAACAYYPSAFTKAAILTIDGIGEYDTTVLWKAKNIEIEKLKSLHFPHSLGLLYSTFTAFLGFRVNEDEYKVMGLAAYGKPVYTDAIQRLVNIKKDGSFALNMKYFSFREKLNMWNKDFEILFGKPRKPNEKVLQKHKNIAASIQKVSQDIYLGILNHLYEITKLDTLCVGGGVALNALANGKIHEKTPFKNVYILGCAGDSGGAIGAALFAYHTLMKKQKRRHIESLCLGTAYSDAIIEKILNDKKLNFKKFSNTNELLENAALLLAKNQIIGWFQDNMEFGPRALGSRSILANPKQKTMKNKVNNLKFREEFRPFAGSILEEYISEYFEIPGHTSYFPFMNFCFQVKKEKIKDISAIVHTDRSCRIQTIGKNNSIYYHLINMFRKKTGIPCILNTSFNLKGEPIVETPEQAVEDFLKTKLDYLFIGNFLVEKTV